MIQQESPLPCEVIFLTALPVECHAVLAYLQEPQEVVHPTGTIYHQGNFVGKHRTWRAAVAEIGMGGLSAATETERAITFFRPEIVLFVGIAGGLKDVSRGDVVVATKVYNYESGKALRLFQPRPEVWRASYALEQRARAEAHHDEWLSRLTNPSPDPAPQVFVGALAAGEKVVASKQSSVYRLLQATYGDARAIEMEGHGFLQAVHANHRVQGLVIRGISDLIDDKAAADRAGAQQVAAQHAAAFAFQVLANFTLPPTSEPSRTQPSSLLNLPFDRNPFFTGREAELQKLHTRLQQNQSMAIGQKHAISGLGGIGKTQLAVEYAYRHHNEYHTVLWVLAESIEALTSSFTEIARLLNLPEKDAEEQEVTIQAVKRWLQREHDWLLILDNADTPDLILDFLPSTVGGHLLITTRVADLSAHMASLAHPLMMDTFSEEQGALFLLHRSGLLALDATLVQVETSTWECARAIVRQLGGLPLALDQAGAYLNATCCSLASYQQLYQQHRAQLLKERRGTDHPAPVATTWNISFRNVEQHNPAAADLLRLCAFLAPEAIPETILTQGAEVFGPVFTDAYKLNEAIEALRAYSLITRDPSLQTLTVHRLVQAVLRDAMDGSDRQRWVERAIKIICLMLPAVEHRHWSQWERVLAHALACSAWIEQLGVHLPEATELLQRTGWYLTERARYDEAKPLVERAYWISHQEQGAEHLDTARDAESLAYLYTIQGKYEQAEPLYQQALAIYEQQLGPTHLQTVTCLNNLALLYGGQGKYEQAEPLHQRVLAICEQQLGPEHPHTASSLNNLGALYQSQGKYEQAEPLYQRALAIDEQQLGPEHPDTANSLNNLAHLYYVQDKYELAEPLYQRALAIREQQVGPEHPDTAQSLNNLAALYRSQGKYAEAERLYKRTLSICEQRLGPMHPHMANSLNNLAYLYQSQGKYEQAEPLYQQALAIYEQQLGPAHPQTASSLNNLAYLYNAQGKGEQAEPLFQRALMIWEQQVGPPHPDMAKTLNNLAHLYYAQGKYEQAEPLLVRALSIWSPDIFTPQNPRLYSTPILCPHSAQ